MRSAPTPAKARGRMRLRGLVLLAAAAAIDTEDAPEAQLRECGRPSSARRQLEHDCVGDLTECRRSVGACELRSKPLLICVHNSPFEALGVLAPLQLFDVQTVVVRGRLGGVRTVRASDDSAVHAAVAAYRHGGAVNHTLTMLGNAGASAGWMTDGAGALAGAWELFFSTVAWATEPAGGAQPPKATSETLRVAFSPYGTSCVALSLGGGVARVEEIELARERMVVSIAQPRERRPKLPWDELPLGVRPCVVVAAAVLFQLAAPLAHSIFFHYAGGVTLSMVLGIFILAYFAAGWVPGRRKTVVLVAATGWLGATYAALTHLVALYWHWVVAYCAFFGAVGYFLTFYVTRGGGARPCDPSLPRPPRPRTSLAPPSHRRPPPPPPARRRRRARGVAMCDARADDQARRRRCPRPRLLVAPRPGRPRRHRPRALGAAGNARRLGVAPLLALARRASRRAAAAALRRRQWPPPPLPAADDDGAVPLG